MRLLRLEMTHSMSHKKLCLLPGPFLDFLDPWGNRIEIVGYDNIQFTKAPNVLRGMGLTHLSKNAKAIKELTEKGMAPN
jgi:lactoylglutathione lyase